MSKALDVLREAVAATDPDRMATIRVSLLRDLYAERDALAAEVTRLREAVAGVAQACKSAHRDDDGEWLLVTAIRTAIRDALAPVVEGGP